MLVTGSMGFIGKRLRYSAMIKDSRARFSYFGGRLDGDEFSRFIDSSGPFDVVIHLAGSSHGGMPKLLNSNVASIYHLVDNLTRRFDSLFHLILASSGGVYRSDGSIPSKETDPLAPASLYGVSKMFGEELSAFFEAAGKIDLCVLRLANVFGPGNANGITGKFLSSISANQPIVIHGDGEQTRQFVHVDDVCELLLRLTDEPVSGLFNVGSPIVLSVRDLVRIFGESYSFDICHVESPNSIEHLAMDWSRARCVLNFIPRFREFRVEDLNW